MGPGLGVGLGAVELVGPDYFAGGGQDRVGRGGGFAVAEGEAGRHGGVDGEDGAHGGAVQGAGQVEQAGTLGGDRDTAGGGGRDGVAEGLVGRQGAGVHFREAAAQDQAGRARGQSLVAQGVERDHVQAGRGQQLAVLGVAEGEGGPAGHGHDRAPARVRELGRGPGRAGQVGRAAGQGQQGGQVAGGGDQGPETGGGLGGVGRAFRHRDQAQMAGGRADLVRTPDGAEDREARGGQRVPQELFVPVGTDLVEDDAGHGGAGVEAVESGGHRGHGAARGGGVDDQDHRGAQEAGHMGRGAEAGVAGALAGWRGGPVEQAHHALDDGHVGAAGAMEKQRRDTAGAAQGGVQVAGRAAGGQRVVAGVDVVGAHLVAGHDQAGGAQGRHQPAGDRRLAAARGRGGDDQPGHGYHSMPFWPF